MDVQLTWTDCDEAGDNVVPKVFNSPRDLVSRPDNMDKTVLHTPILLKSTSAECYNVLSPFLELFKCHIPLEPE